MQTSQLARTVGITLGRSFFPLLALVVVAGAMLWGPWVSLLIAVASWRIVARVA